MIPPKELILKYLKDNDIRQAWLAKKLNTKPQYLWKKFNKKDIDGMLITEIGRIVKHNFYKDLAKLFEQEYKTTHIETGGVEEEQAKYGDETILRKIVREEVRKIIKVS